MKYMLSLLITLLLATSAKADTPTPPWFEALAPDVFLKNASSDQEGHFVKKVARFVFNVPTDGGTAATYDLGIKLPASALIVRSYFKIITAFSGSGSASVALQCEDANNIYSAAVLGGTGYVEGASTNTAATFKGSIAADCAVSAVVGSNGANYYLTAGKLVGWVEYVMEN